jgi:hypothetical protein
MPQEGVVLISLEPVVSDDYAYGGAATAHRHDDHIARPHV